MFGQAIDTRWAFLRCYAAALCGLLFLSQISCAENTKSASADVMPFVQKYCLDCHSGESSARGLRLDRVNMGQLARQSKIWERVVRKLRSRQMPPADAERPAEKTYQVVLARLESALDREAVKAPRPGRTATFRRLTRVEYQNTIRDLLALDVDVTNLLPADESSHGFDNITVGDLNPTLLNRYLSAAIKISDLAVAAVPGKPGGFTHRVRPDITQEQRLPGLPPGTRGGTVFRYTFPADGEYEIRVRLARDRNEHVEGLREAHQLELLLDRRRLKLFTVRPPKGSSSQPGDWSKAGHANVDRHLRQRLRVKAGAHEVGVTFVKKPTSLLLTKRQPLNVHFNMYRHPRLGPAVFQVSISGPFDAKVPTESASRRKLFVCRPKGKADEEACARRIISSLMRRAYRRPVTDRDLRKPLELFRQARQQGSFDAGIQLAVGAVLVNPNFLFRIEQPPSGVKPGEVYRLSDLQLASRLSFFLWSSIPDDELLRLASAGKLSQPEVLKRQVERMLADERSAALVENFAGQWLFLRNLDSITPDLRLFPDFDDNLRQAMRRETELFFQSVLRENRSVMQLLKADYTYLNERLARHYGIPHVAGSRFRRVSLPRNSRRGGLLRQASVLTVTSYATRTSPVLRGKWVLENLLGTVPPPPPANVPALKDNTVAANLSVRERLAEHRANVACASCHNLIDPVGFSLENYDAVGRWRFTEQGRPVDATGGLPDGSRFVGVDGLEAGLLRRPEIFATTLSEKLLTYALGRGVGHNDGPAIRAIVREARAHDYRFGSLIQAIVNSTPFRMRTAQ